MTHRIVRSNGIFSDSLFLKSITVVAVLVCLALNSTFAQDKTPIYSKTYVNDAQSGQVEVSVFKKSSSPDSGNASALSSPLSNCNLYSEISMHNISQDAPVDSVGCQNNDSLEVCFTVFSYDNAGNSQWFHGLVPDFGDCLNVFPTPEGEPGYITQPMTNLSMNGQWQWFPDGVTNYNNIPNGYYPPDTPVGAGWFYIYDLGNLPGCVDNTNPNCTYGDGFGGAWQVCFLAEPICTEPGLEFCEISFRTFSDGETGGWTSPGCQEDEPWVYSFTKLCCEEPIILNEEVAFEVCSPELFTLDLVSSMDPETTYDWYVAPNPYGATSGSGSTISDVLSNTTGSPVTVVYYVTPTCSFGCIGEQLTITVTIFPEVQVEVIPPYSLICEGECENLSAIATTGSSPFSYNWSNGINDTESILVCNGGFYSVTVIDANGCVSESGSMVDVIPPLDSPEINCIALDNSIEFYWNDIPNAVEYLVNGIPQSGTNFIINNLPPNETVTITVEAISNDGCPSSFAEASCTTLDCPNISIDIQNVQDYCSNELPLSNVTFEAFISGGSGNGIGSWAGPGIVDASNGVFDPNSSEVAVGANEIIFTYEEGTCFYSENLTINIFEAPIAEATIVGIFDCANNSVVLEPTIQNDVVYSWTTPDGTIVNETQLEAFETGVYILTATNLTSNCSASESILVENFATPPIADAGADKLVNCNFPEIILDGINSETGANIQYLWTGPASGIIGDDDQIQALANLEGMYYLKVTNTSNGCFSMDSVYVTTDLIAPTVDAGIEQSLGCNDQSFVIAGTASLDADEFVWQDENSAIVSADLNAEIYAPGWYALTATNSTNGCFETDSVYISGAEPIAVDLGTDFELEIGESETISLQSTITASSIASVQWTPSEGVVCLDDDCLNILVNPVQTTSFGVIVTDIYGCSAEDQIMVRVKQNLAVFVPNVFTPNNDGVNDVFKIFSGTGVKEIQNLKIFSRWGELVFELPRITQENNDDSSYGWDGKINGKALNSGVFVYTMDVVFKDGRIEKYKGDLTLIR